MPLSYSLMEAAASFALGPNVARFSTFEAPFSRVLAGTLFELLAKLVFNVIGGALQELLDFEVVALFRAATAVGTVEVEAIVVSGAPWVRSRVGGRSGDGAIVGFEDAEEVGGGGLVVGESVQDLVLIRDETT